MFHVLLLYIVYDCSMAAEEHVGVIAVLLMQLTDKQRTQV